MSFQQPQVGYVVSSGALVNPGGAQGPGGASGDTAMVGAIQAYPSTTPPAGWMVCDGSPVSRSAFPQLFSLIGTTFGTGDGTNTFNLPDLRSRVPLGAGQGSGLTNRVIAASGGEENHVLGIGEMPSHSHPLNYVSTFAGAGGQAGFYPGAGTASATGTAGSGTGHNTIPPFLVVCFIIKVSQTVPVGTTLPLADTTQSGLLRQVSGTSTDYVGGDNATHPLVQVNGFLAKTAAYTLTLADRNKYIICSGGSWTLTLPAAAVGLCYNVRNDMGITGTTGTITIQPAAGTINGAISIPLLPAQECLLVSDGTNWRTFGLQRVVVLGTQDITTPTAAWNVVLLPSGYRYFELEFMGVSPAANDSLVGQFSPDSGTTWYNTALYYDGVINNNSATAVGFSDGEGVTYGRFLPANLGNTPSQTSLGKLTIFPGSPTQAPTYISDAGTRANPSLNYKWQLFGFYNAAIRINAFRYACSLGGNLNASSLTVKGIV